MRKTPLMKAVQAALQSVPAGLTELAAEVGCSSSLLRYARAGSKPLAPEYALRVVTALRTRARRMEDCAARLDRVCRSTVTGRST